MDLYRSYYEIGRHNLIMVNHNSIMDLHKTNKVLGNSICRSQCINHSIDKFQ